MKYTNPLIPAAAIELDTIDKALAYMDNHEYRVFFYHSDGWAPDNQPCPDLWAVNRMERIDAQTVRSTMLVRGHGEYICEDAILPEDGRLFCAGTGMFIGVPIR